MSSCCSDNQDKSMASCCDKHEEDKKPTNFIEKFLWRIGKKEAEKDKNKNKKGCC